MLTGRCLPQRHWLPGADPRLRHRRFAAATRPMATSRRVSIDSNSNSALISSRSSASLSSSRDSSFDRPPHEPHMKIAKPGVDLPLLVLNVSRQIDQEKEKLVQIQNHRSVNWVVASH